MKKLAALDFETEAISGNYPPPKPVGFSVTYMDGYSNYYAFGHPSENNCSEKKARAIYKDIIRRYDVVFHHSKFDCSVALHHWGAWPSNKVHDTLFAAFINNPREPSFALKTLSNQPPNEQREMFNWIKDNVRGAREGSYGAHICKVPGKLAGKYAIGDTVRTMELFRRYKDIIGTRAYDIETDLMPVIVRMEREGVIISDKVYEELSEAREWMSDISYSVKKIIGNVNLNSGQAILKACIERSLVDEAKVRYTEKGNPMAGRDEIARWCLDKKLVDLLSVRSRLSKIMSTYLVPWSECGGVFHPYYTQTKGGSAGGGTVTGRLSSNFQQVPRDGGLINLRKLISAGKKRVFAIRDWSSQEIRILAHFAGGSLAEAYRKDPRLDPHSFVGNLIKEKTGVELDRSHIKQANFLQIYGGGYRALANIIGCDERKARRIMSVHEKTLKEPKKLMRRLEEELKTRGYIETWSGRKYSVERLPSGKPLYYKMVNVLIQGSAADQAKRAMVEAYSSGLDVNIQVHDELIVRSEKGSVKKAMKVMKEIMNDSIGWDVPMRSDGKIGKTWGKAK